MERPDLSGRGRAVVHDGPMAAWRWDPAEKTLTWSEGMFEVFGVDPEEWDGHGHPVRDFAVAEDRGRVEEVLETVRSGAKPQPLECRILRRDGAMRWVRIEGDTFTDEVGKLVVIGIVRDITERKRAEEALRESEERFRRVFTEGPLGMAVVEPSFRMAHVNQRLCELLGYDADELQALTFAEVTHPDDLEKDVKLAEQVFRGEIPFYEIDKRFVKKDGEVIWAHLTASLVCDEDGTAMYGLGMVEDITERKRAEEALQVSERKFRRVVEMVNAAIIVADNEVIRLANSAMERLTGYTREEMAGKDPRDLLLHPDFRYLARAWESSFAAGGDHAQRYRFKILTKSGAERWVDFAGTMIDIEGVPTGILTANDISEQVKAEGALRDSEERYRALSESSADGVCVFQEGRVEFVNAGLLQMLGYSEEEFKSIPPMEMMAPGDRERAAQRMQELLQGGGPEHVSQYRCLKKDGGIVVIEGVARAIQYGGKPAVLSVTRDITGSERSHDTESFLEALQGARIALEQVAALLPRDSTGDVAAVEALGKIYKIMQAKERPGTHERPGG